MGSKCSRKKSISPEDIADAASLPNKDDKLIYTSLVQTAADCYTIPETKYMPFGIHWPSPELYAAHWSVEREIWCVCARIPRHVKETLNAFVSVTNDCGFCTGGHLAFASIAGSEVAGSEIDGTDIVKAVRNKDLSFISDKTFRSYANWSAHHREWDSEAIQNPPFGIELAPEIVGSAFMFNYINRMVFSLMDGRFIPKNEAPDFVRKFAMKLPVSLQDKGSRSFFNGQYITKKNIPGEGMEELHVVDEKYEWGYEPDFRWSEASPLITKALRNFNFVVDQLADEYIPNTIQVFALNFLDTRFTSQDMGISRNWTKTFIETANFETELENHIAKIILLVIASPHQMSEDLLEEYLNLRDSEPDETEMMRQRSVVAMLTWTAFHTARTIGKNLAQPVIDAEAQ